MENVKKNTKEEKSDNVLKKCTPLAKRCALFSYICK